MKFGNISSSVDLVSFNNAEQPTTVLFYQGCNFRCGYCHNGGIWKSETEPLNEVGLKRVLSMAKRRWIKTITLTGGEPTEQPEGLQNLVRHLKNQGFKIKLDTNGSNPELLAELVDNNLLDYVAMDVKGTLEQYPEIVGFSDVEKIRASIGIVREMGAYEFRTTVVPKYHEEPEIREIGALLHGSRRYAMQQFRPDLDGGCLNPEFCKLDSYQGDTLREFAELVEDDFEQVIVRARD